MRVMTVQRVRTEYVLPPKFFFSGISIGMASMLWMRMPVCSPVPLARGSHWMISTARMPWARSCMARYCPTRAVGKAISRAVATVLGSRVVTREDSLTEPLDTLLSELEQFGKANDGATTERPRRMLNITRDTGEFLAVLVRATLARRILEIGTSNGYSTLWLAGAARAIGGSVTSVELSDYKVGLARATFARSGLAGFILLVQDDAGRMLRRSADGAYDLVFLDSERGVSGLVAGSQARAPARRL